MARHDDYYGPLTNLRRLRQRRFLSQGELATDVGLDISTIRRLETGAGRALGHTVRKLAAALDVKPEELMREEPS